MTGPAVTVRVALDTDVDALIGLLVGGALTAREDPGDPAAYHAAGACGEATRTSRPPGALTDSVR